jgi:hypothetical protein
MTRSDLILILSRPTEAAFFRIIEKGDLPMSEPVTGAPPAAPTPPTAGPPASVPTPSRLDAILVVGVLFIVGFVLWRLLAADLKLTLPIVASIVSALISAVIAGYAGYRWGASEALKKAAAQ